MKSAWNGGTGSRLRRLRQEIFFFFVLVWQSPSSSSSSLDFDFVCTWYACCTFILLCEKTTTTTASGAIVWCTDRASDETRKLSKAFLCFRFCHHHRHEEENMMLTDVQLASRNDLRPIDWSKVLATSQHQHDEATSIDVVDVIDRRRKYALFQLVGSTCVVYSANIYYPSS